jgi:hypothetical protein
MQPIQQSAQNLEDATTDDDQNAENCREIIEKCDTVIAKIKTKKKKRVKND